MSVDLSASLRNRIKKEGSLPLSEWIATCNQAYYADHTIGQDFITAPEISPLFGETLAIWAIQQWQQLGEPSKFHLAELGSGNGTLSSDVLRTIGKVQKVMRQAAQLHLVETSQRLQKKQATTLADFNIPKYWHDSIDTLPTNQPIILLANEFFDALPIEQITASGEQQHITWQDNTFHFTLQPQPFREVCAVGQTIMATLCQRLRQQRGAALIIDYGYTEPSMGDTLQALQHHQFASPLANPGQVDLTAHVDFSALGEIANRANLSTQLTTQGEFLQAYGINMRLQQNLPTVKDPADYQSRYDRLVSPKQMGNLFKVLSVHS